MFGILIWTPPERGKRQKAVAAAERMMLHTRFTCVYVLRGPRTPEAVVRRRVSAAAKKFQRMGVRRVVLPESFAYEALLARRELGPVDTLTLRRELAAELVRRGLEDRGLSGGGRVAVSADAMSAELVRTVTELALRCRYVLLDVPLGGEELAGRLRREYGVSLLLAPDRAQLESAEALVLFAPRTDLRGGNPVVEVYQGAAASLPPLLLPPALEEQLPSGCCRPQLLAALRESGALRPGQITFGRRETAGNGLGA